MQKRAPTLANMIVIVLFVLSCFGLLLFLWESFGGPVPLKPKGYRMTVAFPKSLALAEQSEVRISGVNIGRVVALKHGHGGRTRAELEINQKYAPIRANMHAILRQKTLLGETYVQLIPQNGGHTGPFLADNGQLADCAGRTVGHARRHPLCVRSEDAPRLPDLAAVAGRRDQRARRTAQRRLLRDQPFVQHANTLVGILASQEGAVRALVKNTGVVFNALGSRDHQLEGLIVNGEHSFHALSEGSQAFAAAFRALPTFERKSRTALKELDRFATVASPFLDEFRPVERKLSTLLNAAKPFAPQFDSFLTSLGPLSAAAKKGLPDVGKTLDLTTTQLQENPPGAAQPRSVPAEPRRIRPRAAGVLRQLHRRDAGSRPEHEHARRASAALPALDAGAQPGEPGGLLPARRHRPVQPLLQARRLPRAGQWRAAGVQQQQLLQPGAFGQRSAQLDDLQSLIEQIIQFKVANTPETPNSIAAPGCNQQGPFTFNGQTGQFPHVVYGGK